MIADCGGAMEVGRCNECGAPIGYLLIYIINTPLLYLHSTSHCLKYLFILGGQSHTLLGDNAFAGEIDGATAPAWPTMLNRR